MTRIPDYVAALLSQQLYGPEQCHTVDEALKVDETFIYAVDFILKPLQLEHELAVRTKFITYFIKGLIVLHFEADIIRPLFNFLL